MKQSLLLALASAAILAGCDDSTTPAVPTAPAKPQVSVGLVFPRSDWFVTDTGSGVVEGDTLRIRVLGIPYRTCTPNFKLVVRSDTLEGGISLDARGAPVRMVFPKVDTLLYGSLVRRVLDFAPYEGRQWTAIERDSVTTLFARDSFTLAYRKAMSLVRVLDWRPDGGVVVHTAHWAYGEAMAQVWRSQVSSEIRVEVSDPNTVRLTNTTNGEVVTAAFLAEQAGVRVAWSSSDTTRPAAVRGGEPTSCPAPSMQPTWLSSFLAGK